MREIYENDYSKKNHFSFGKNWQNFLKTLNDEKVEEAKKSLVDFLGGKDKIKGKTFVDIGCGSGLFSLAAYKLGASKIISVDIDDFSIACVRYLKNKEKNSNNWQIKKGSALNKEFINSLGRFDIVYSWGVLHHTGNMYESFDNVIELMRNRGILYLAIYNKQEYSFRGGTSSTWHKIKRVYNDSSLYVKKIMEYIYIAYIIIMLLLRLKNPVKYIKNYKTFRGMNWYYDMKDWIGGYPYEFASAPEIVNYFGKKDILCRKIIPKNGTGCNEFLLENK